MTAVLTDARASAAQSSESRLSKPTLEDIRRAFAYQPFEYIDLPEAKILNEISVGWCGWVFVVGHPEDASYEWVVREDGMHDRDRESRWKRSNCGYGCSASALRDGLIYALG